jgi:UDP-N-acetylglucosamine--N-acetylmuramyl-(pentapeptide) pyrophosphoryl-undecaprenol N-acetylglucosamine transferase
MNQIDIIDGKHYFFAGGGTGGHIYPALAVAEQITKKADGSSMLFFCSSREIDARILSKSGYEFLPLPAVGFSKSPRQLFQFCMQLVKSYYFVKHILMAYRRNTVVIGTGGFVSAPVVFAAKALKIPVYLVNTDSVPGKANRLLARYARKVFVQFEQSQHHFPKREVVVVGCPLRSDFQNPSRHKAFSDLALEEGKKVLLVTGASSGASNINDAMLSIMGELAEFSADWQVVHLTGVLHIDEVQRAIEGLDISYHAVDYYDDMASLLAAADVVIGRAGAVSVAEFAATGVPAVCLPYPYHKDNHQRKNAQVLVDVGAAVIVDDNTESPTRTANDLLIVLKDLLGNESKRTAMAACARDIGTTDAASKILDSVTM